MYMMFNYNFQAIVEILPGGEPIDVDDAPEPDINLNANDDDDDDDDDDYDDDDDDDDDDDSFYFYYTESSFKTFRHNPDLFKHTF